MLHDQELVSFFVHECLVFPELMSPKLQFQTPSILKIYFAAKFKDYWYILPGQQIIFK